MPMSSSSGCLLHFSLQSISWITTRTYGLVMSVTEILTTRMRRLSNEHRLINQIGGTLFIKMQEIDVYVAEGDLDWRGNGLAGGGVTKHE